MKRKEITWSYPHEDVQFLSGWPEIEYLSISTPNVKDITGVYSLKKLKVLALNNAPASLVFDFSQLAALEELYGVLPQENLRVRAANGESVEAE